MEFNTDSDEDSETQLNEIEQLNKVLEQEADCDVPSISETSSHYESFSKLSSPSPSKAQDEYSKIEKALNLNKQVDEKLSRLEKVLTFKLRQCRLKICELRGEINISKRARIEKPDKFRYYNCGRPYFRDKSNFPAPDNEDTILMTKSNMYDFSQVLSVPGWTVRDKSQFMMAIQKMSQEMHKNHLKSKIAQIKRDNKCKSNDVINKMIEEIHDEIASVSKKHLRELALPIDQDYDWETLANKLNGRHTAQEYKALWKLFFHPSINKSSWSKTEHLALQEIAKNNNLQDWDDIARKHNTGRTGYQTFVYYRTNMSNSFIGRKWTNEEVEYVKRLIDYYREDNYIPWGKVAASMQNRTKIQIYNKYLRLIEERKGRFLAEEDAVILHCVNKFGANFRKIASYLPGRSIIQLRTRYKVLTKMRISAVWTVKEDKKLLQIMSNQDLSMNFSDITSHFPGKDRSNLRTRYHVLLRWMRKYPNVDIARAPRRGARRLPQGQAGDDLMKALDNLKKRMQTEVEHKKSKKATIESSEIDIENGIVAALVNESLKKASQMENNEEPGEPTVTQSKQPQSPAKNMNVLNITKILILLNSKLQKNVFMKSHYNQQYPALAEPNKEVSTVKIKSYSRKETVQNIRINNCPEIWGKECLGPLNYVLPPQYATLTGCRALMMHAASRPVYDTPISINVLTKRNNSFKEQMQCLMDRFYTLFVWPMLLSNEGPHNKNVNNQNSLNKCINKKHGQEMPSTPSVTMPLISEEEKIKCDDTIDLNEPLEKGNITLDESFSDENFI